jgi:hypothetical protein
MSLTPSTMLPLGTLAPDFRLPDVTQGHLVSLDDFSSFDALLVMFICRHCPYVKHIEGELARLGRDFARKSRGNRGHQRQRRRNPPGRWPHLLKGTSARSWFFVSLSLRPNPGHSESLFCRVYP